MGSRDRSWQWSWFLLRRVISYAFWGGLATAALGAGLTGAFVYWAKPYDYSITIIRGVRNVSLFTWGWQIFYMDYLELLWGLRWGALCCGLPGTVCFGLVGFFSRPNLRFLPPRRILVPTLIAMVLASLLAVAGFALVDGMIKASHPANFWLALIEPRTIAVGGLVLIMLGEMVGLAGGLKLEKAENHG